MIEVKVRELIKNAMKEKNELAKLVYKSVLDGALKIAKLDKNREVTEDDFISAAKNEIKALEDLKNILVEKGRNDNLEEIDQKLALLKDLIPKAVSDEEVREFLVTNNIEKNMGACMKALKSQFGSTLDGKAASAVVRDYIK